jgi:hypothetical protein
MEAILTCSSGHRPMAVHSTSAIISIDTQPQLGAPPNPSQTFLFVPVTHHM